jgi:hypothetical protein
MNSSNKVSARRHYHNTIVERRQRQQNNFQREIKQFKSTAECREESNSEQRQKTKNVGGFKRALRLSELGTTL